MGDGSRPEAAGAAERQRSPHSGSDSLLRAVTRRLRIWKCARSMGAAGTTCLGILIVLLAIAVLGGPLPGDAQQEARLPRVGFLFSTSPSDSRVPRVLQAFRQGLGEAGYVEGQNIAIEFRWAEGQDDRLPGLAAELVRLKVNVIVAGVPAAIQAAKQATATIPIIISGAADPVAAGWAASLARPGGNITGVSYMMPDLVGKQLGLLKEALPKVSRVALLGNPAGPVYTPWLRYAQDAARGLGVRLQVLEARGGSGIDSAFEAMTRERADAVIVLPDAVLLFHRARIADHAVRRRLPTVSGASDFAEAGGLLTYGASIDDGYRRAAIYVGKILKGARAAELPVEQPTQFELVINLKTAKALGLTLPQAVLLRADRVIQ